MKRSERELSETKENLAEAKDVLRAAERNVKKVKKVKKAKGNKLEKKNAKLVMETIEDGVEFVEDRRETLQKQVKRRDKLR
jgi:hypothetical protein